MPNSTWCATSHSYWCAPAETFAFHASVAMMRTGANASVDSATVSQQAVIGYVLVKGGLMANLSLEGTKVSPLEL